MTAVTWGSNPENNGGNSYTYTKSTTNGDTWTINTAGNWALVFFANEESVSGQWNNAFLSRNASPTTKYADLSIDKNLGVFTTGNAFEKPLCFVGYFKQGDVIRTQTQAKGNWKASPASFFRLSLLNVS